jgi:hypothetical protein
MSWNPTTGATGNGNPAAGSYNASGTATTLYWGTQATAVSLGSGGGLISGFLTITKISQKTIVAFNEKLPNGDGLTAGQVLGIDGFQTEVEVRDDSNQPVNSLTVGQTVYVADNGGLVPGGARGAYYKARIVENGWEAAPKTPAGRTLSLENFILIN